MKLIKKIFIQKMSLEELDIFQNLFLEEKVDNCLNFSTLSDNLNDIISEFSEEPRKKNIKFILTKEEAPSMTFLKKKLSCKILDDKGNSNGGRWNKDEQYRFAEAVLKYGNDWKQIQSHVFSRNMTQVRSHAQKFLMKLKETNFMMNQKINPNLSWTKIMNYLRENFKYNELKDLFFSVEQKEEKKVEKKKVKKINKSNKHKKNNNTELSSAGDSNCDTNGESFHIFSENDSFNEINFEKEEKDEKEALEKFIECFNNTSEDINLNSSFEEISIQDDINEYQKEPYIYNSCLKI